MNQSRVVSGRKQQPQEHRQVAFLRTCWFFSFLNFLFVFAIFFFTIVICDFVFVLLCYSFFTGGGVGGGCGSVIIIKEKYYVYIWRRN